MFRAMGAFKVISLKTIALHLYSEAVVSICAIIMHVLHHQHVLRCHSVEVNGFHW